MKHRLSLVASELCAGLLTVVRSRTGRSPTSYRLHFQECVRVAKTLLPSHNLLLDNDLMSLSTLPTHSQTWQSGKVLVIPASR